MFFDVFSAGREIVDVFNQNKTNWWFQFVFLCSPVLGEMIQFDGSHIFQMGWLKPPTRNLKVVQTALHIPMHKNTLLKETASRTCKVDDLELM